MDTVKVCFSRECCSRPCSPTIGTIVGPLLTGFPSSKTFDKVRSKSCCFLENILKLLLREQSVDVFAGYPCNHTSKTLVVARGSRGIDLGDSFRKIIHVPAYFCSFLELPLRLRLQGFHVILVRNSVDPDVEHHRRRAVLTSATGVIIEGIHELNHGLDSTCIIAL